MSHIRVAAFLAFGIILALGLTHCGDSDPPPLAVEAVPASKTICPKSMNPCRVVNCDKPNPRIYT